MINGAAYFLTKLGRTGVEVTMLGLGGAHIGWTTEKQAQEVIEKAIEGGVRFFDCAESYSDGESELRFGKYLVPKYRDDVFIMTKSTATDAITAKNHLEGSLKRLNSGYIDLWQVHSLKTPEDVDKRIENEVLDVFVKAKAEGKVKHIGFTGHQNPFAHKHMLEKTADNDIFETIQMPINAIDSHYHSFIKNVLPLAVERNIGILAMKTLSDGRFFREKRVLDKVQWESDDPLIPNYISVKEALYFVWSLPVSVLITGPRTLIFCRKRLHWPEVLQKSQKTRDLNCCLKFLKRQGIRLSTIRRCNQELPDCFLETSDPGEELFMKLNF